MKNIHTPDNASALHAAESPLRIERDSDSRSLCRACKRQHSHGCAIKVIIRQALMLKLIVNCNLQTEPSLPLIIINFRYMLK